jgi:hypothetical protein
VPKPSLQSYGLSEHDVVSFRRWENADSRGPVVCGIVGGACGYFGLANLGDGGLEFFGAWLGFIFGTGLCDWVGPKLRKWDSRLQRYDLFKAATKRFEAATEAFESAKKEVKRENCSENCAPVLSFGGRSPVIGSNGNLPSCFSGKATTLNSHPVLMTAGSTSFSSAPAERQRFSASGRSNPLAPPSHESFTER